MGIAILDDLIIEGEMLTKTISFVPFEGYRSYDEYKTSESERYQNWQSSVLRFIKTHHSSDLDEFREAATQISPDNHRKILGILRAIKLLPTEPTKEVPGKPSPANNIHITNNQNNTNQINVNLFLEAIKDELTGKDLKEIKEILKGLEAEPTKTKNKLIEKIKGFGGNVLSNIVANILTNPAIYNGLF